jgi:hypothetical protein
LELHDKLPGGVERKGNTGQKYSVSFRMDYHGLWMVCTHYVYTSFELFAISQFDIPNRKYMWQKCKSPLSKFANKMHVAIGISTLLLEVVFTLFQGPEHFSKFRVPRNWFWKPFYKFRVPKN